VHWNVNDFRAAMEGGPPGLVRQTLILLTKTNKPEMTGIVHSIRKLLILKWR
jgi:hypothetical protein